MVRVIQISDTHLSRSKAHFAANWPPVCDWVRRRKPDLVIHTGDLTVDGADSEADMRDGAQFMRELRTPWLAVPGNHDVGEAGNPHQPIDAERLARWRRHIGDDRWSRDIEGWRLIGLDSMLFGAGDDEEARQLAWLDEVSSSANGRRLAWFTHRPLFIDDPAEGDMGYWSVKPAPRAKLLERIRRDDVAIVATGHLHKWRDYRLDGCRYIWGASSGFLVGPDNQPDLPGEKRLGGAIFEFTGTGVAIAHEDVSGLAEYWIDDVLHEVYPPRGAA
jgi:alkaline phosphatase D